MGVKMDQPTSCTNEIWNELFCPCFAFEPENRPTFAVLDGVVGDIVSSLEADGATSSLHGASSAGPDSRGETEKRPVAAVASAPDYTAYTANDRAGDAPPGAGLLFIQVDQDSTTDDSSNCINVTDAYEAFKAGGSAASNIHIKPASHPHRRASFDAYNSYMAAEPNYFGGTESDEEETGFGFGAEE